MISWKIYEEYPKNHPIFNDICPVCDEKFKVGDEITLVPIQRSKSHKSFDAVAIPIHADCYEVE